MDLDKLRKTAAEIVSRDDVKYLLGWRRGTFGYRVAPYFIEDAAGVDELIFFTPLYLQPGYLSYLSRKIAGSPGARA